MSNVQIKKTFFYLFIYFIYLPTVENNYATKVQSFIKQIFLRQFFRVREILSYFCFYPSETVIFKISYSETKKIV